MNNIIDLSYDFGRRGGPQTVGWKIVLSGFQLIAQALASYGWRLSTNSANDFSNSSALSGDESDLSAVIFLKPKE